MREIIQNLTIPWITGGFNNSVIPQWITKAPTERDPLCRSLKQLPTRQLSLPQHRAADAINEHWSNHSQRIPSIWWYCWKQGLLGCCGYAPRFGKRPFIFFFVHPFLMPKVSPHFSQKWFITGSGICKYYLFLLYGNFTRSFVFKQWPWVTWHILSMNRQDRVCSCVQYITCTYMRRIWQFTKQLTIQKRSVLYHKYCVEWKEIKKLELLLTGFQTYDRLTGKLNINFSTCSWGACFLFPWYWHVRPFLLVIRILSCGPSWRALTSTLFEVLFGPLDFFPCALGTQGLRLRLCDPRPYIHRQAIALIDERTLTHYMG